MVKSRNIIFQKSQKLLTERALSELHGGSLFRTFNFNGGLCKRRIGFCLLRTPSPRGTQFLWFLKIDPLRFHHIYLLYDWSKLFVFLMCILRINLPNLCPNMIHVDALDFSGWHSKEVISFFWRSVYNIFVPFLSLGSAPHWSSSPARLAEMHSGMSVPGLPVGGAFHGTV